jgi:hypothetical protein
VPDGEGDGRRERRVHVDATDLCMPACRMGAQWRDPGGGGGGDDYGGEPTGEWWLCNIAEFRYHAQPPKMSEIYVRELAHAGADQGRTPAQRTRAHRRGRRAHASAEDERVPTRKTSARRRGGRAHAGAGDERTVVRRTSARRRRQVRKRVVGVRRRQRRRRWQRHLPVDDRRWVRSVLGAGAGAARARARAGIRRRRSVCGSAGDGSGANSKWSVWSVHARSWSRCARVREARAERPHAARVRHTHEVKERVLPELDAAAHEMQSTRACAARRKHRRANEAVVRCVMPTREGSELPGGGPGAIAVRMRLRVGVARPPRTEPRTRARSHGTQIGFRTPAGVVLRCARCGRATSIAEARLAAGHECEIVHRQKSILTS